MWITQKREIINCTTFMTEIINCVLWSSIWDEVWIEISKKIIYSSRKWITFIKKRNILHSHEEILQKFFGRNHHIGNFLTKIRENLRHLNSVTQDQNFLCGCTIIAVKVVVQDDLSKMPLEAASFQHEHCDKPAVFGD